MDPRFLAELRNVLQRLQVSTGGGMVDGVPLHTTEHALMSSGVTLWTVQSRRRNYRSGGASVRIPIFAGMSVRVGGNRGESERDLPSAEPSDQGTLLVTDQRLLYLGSLKTDEVPLTRVLALHVDQTAGVLMAHVSRRKVPLIVQPAPTDVERLAAHVGLALILVGEGVQAAEQMLMSRQPSAGPGAASSSSGTAIRPVIPMNPKPKP